MKKYELTWLEEWNEEDFCPENLSNYPFIRVAGTWCFDENNIEVEIVDFFEAKNDIEAYNYVLNNYDLDVFALFRFNNKQIATEEGLL